MHLAPGGDCHEATVRREGKGICGAPKKRKTHVVVLGAAIHEIPPLETSQIFILRAFRIPALQKKSGLGKVSIGNGLMCEIDIGHVLMQTGFCRRCNGKGAILFSSETQVLLSFLRSSRPDSGKVADCRSGEECDGKKTR